MAITFYNYIIINYLVMYLQVFCSLQRYIYFHKNPNNIIAVRQKGIKSLVSYIISTLYGMH